MATAIPLDGPLPIEVLVLLLSPEFPELAEECVNILEEPDLDRETKEHQVIGTLQLYQARLEAGLIDQPPSNQSPRTFFEKFLQREA